MAAIGAERPVREPERFLDILADIGAAADLQSALAALARGAIALLRGDQGAVRVYDIDGRGRHLALWAAPDGALEPVECPDPSPGSVAASLMQGGPERIIDDLWLLDPAVSPLYSELRRRGMRSSVAVPITAGAQRIGSLHIDHHQVGYFTRDHLAMAHALATYAGVVVERARQAARRDVVEALQVSERRFRTLMEQSPLSMQVFTPTGQAIGANAAWERLWGTTRAELAGYNILQDSQLRAKGVMPLIQRAFSGQAVEIPAICYDPAEIGKAGRPRWVRMHCYPVKDENDAIFEVVLVLEDVTEHHKSQEEQQFLADASVALAMSLDYTATLRKVARLAVPTFADWVIVDVLEEVEKEGARPRVRRIAVAAAEAHKERVLETLQQRYPPAWDSPQPAAHALRRGDVVLFASLDQETLAGTVRDGEHLALLQQLAPRSAIAAPLIARGKTIGAITFATSESGREYGQASVRLASDLAGRCALAVDNARLYAEAQAAIRARDDFLAVAAHELKTPATTLRGFAQVTLRRLDRDETLDPQRVRTAMNAIDQQTARLSRLTEQLLDISRIEAGKLELDLEVTDVLALVQSAVESARTRTDRHTLVVEAPPAPVIAHLDSLRMEQVLANLLENAIKYSPAGGQIEVRLASATRNGEAHGEQATRTAHGRQMRLTVRDYGLGIPLEKRERIFDRFFQAHTEGHYSGLGLGLYISKQIVEMHGGAITAEFPSDGGTQFVVDLPIGSLPIEVHEA